MAGEWETVEFGQVNDIFDGPHATPQFSDEGPIFLGIDALDDGRLDLSQTRHVTDQVFLDWTRRVVPQPGDLVFSYETRIGQAALIPEGLKCCLGRRLALVRPKSDAVNSQYLLYYFLAPGFQEHLRAHTKPGSTVDRIHLKDFPRFPLVLPPRRYQDAIANLLGSLDDKIELNRRMAATLEEMARALFKSWFVDFDPVRAKAALFPDRFGEDGLPEGWRLGSVADMVEVNPNLSLRAGTTAPYVDMAALPTTGPCISGYIMRDASSGSRFQLGDTLVARITPCLENGKTALVDFLDDGQWGWGSTEFIVLRPRAPMSRVWPYLLARDDAFRAHLIAAMTGSSGRQRVPPSAVAAWEMALPPSAVLSAFAAEVDPLFERISSLNWEACTLRSLRDTLLPKLISGELRIKDADKDVEAA